MRQWVIDVYHSLIAAWHILNILTFYLKLTCKVEFNVFKVLLSHLQYIARVC